MKQLLLIPLLLIFGTPALADYRQGGGTQQTDCYETIYREEYIPGTSQRPGRVKTFRERVRVPCRNQQPTYNEPRTSHSNVDDNSCIEGAIIGGIAGGGAGAALSRGDGRWWAIPLGVVSGTMVGCQIDGG
jgi:uncharacterized protein YcfJ